MPHRTFPVSMPSGMPPFQQKDAFLQSHRPSPPPKRPSPPPVEKISVEDLICNPGRKARPERIVVIVRGPPGSGKSYASKLLRVGRLHVTHIHYFLLSVLISHTYFRIVLTF